MTADVELLPLPEWAHNDEIVADMATSEVRDAMTAYALANVAHATAAKDAEIEAMREKTAVTMGVGAGDGSLFVHGDHEAIKAAQAIVLQRDALRSEVETRKEDYATLTAMWRTDEAKYRDRAERLAEALRAVLPFVDHADFCGDHDAYNNADIQSCGCGLGAVQEAVDAALAKAIGGEA